MPMTGTRPDGIYSPSLNHRYLMDALTPALAYDGGDVSAWQRRLRRKVKSLLGMPSGDRVALDVYSLWRRQHPLGTIEKIVFRAEPVCGRDGVCLLAQVRGTALHLVHLRPGPHDRSACFHRR